MTLGLKFLLWKYRNFLFQNNSRYVFSIAIMYSCVTICERCLYHIKRMVAVRNYSKDIIMEKKTNRGKGGRVKDMEFSGVK